MANHANLRPIRFVIYLSGILYALVSLLHGPTAGGGGDLGTTLFSSPTAAAVVGTTQLVIVTLGIIADLLGERARRVVKPVFLGLTLTYLYQGVLVLIVVAEPFRWIPLFVYSAICAVIYLSEE